MYTVVSTPVIPGIYMYCIYMYIFLSLSLSFHLFLDLEVSTVYSVCPLERCTAHPFSPYFATLSLMSTTKLDA